MELVFDNNLVQAVTSGTNKSNLPPDVLWNRIVPFSTTVEAFGFVACHDPRVNTSPSFGLCFGSISKIRGSSCVTHRFSDPQYVEAFSGNAGTADEAHRVIGELRSANRDDDPARGRRSAPERARREWRDAFLTTGDTGPRAVRIARQCVG